MRLTQDRHGRRDPGLIIGVQAQESLSLRHLVPGLGKDLDPGSRGDRVVLRGSARAQPPGGAPDREGIALGDHARPLGGQRLDHSRARERGIGITALSADHPTPVVHGAATGNGLGWIGLDSHELEHVASEKER